MTGYSFNRVRTAALKSIAVMQDRLENIATDFGDVDMFLVGEAEQCRDRLHEFAERIKQADDPTAGERIMQGYTLKKVRTRKIPKAPPAPDPQADLFSLIARRLAPAARTFVPEHSVVISAFPWLAPESVETIIRRLISSSTELKFKCKLANHAAKPHKSELRPRHQRRSPRGRRFITRTEIIILPFDPVRARPAITSIGTRLHDRREMRRLGLAKKPMFVVPNHLVEQWGAEFLKLYPQARLFR